MKCNKCIRKVTIYTKKQVRCVTLKKGILTFANNNDVAICCDVHLSGSQR